VWSPRGVQNARGVQMESKSLSRKSFVFIEGCLYVIDQTALKRLASAVRFRPWPPCFQLLTDLPRKRFIPFHSKTLVC